MATLSIEDRQRIWRALMRYWSNQRDTVGGSKAELLTTINETDAWIDIAQSNYAGSLTYRANYSAVQLTLIFCAVAVMRVAPGVELLLRRMLGVNTEA